MNDMYEKGYIDGKEHGYRDGYAKGWHEAMRAKTPVIDMTTKSILNMCPKCNITFNGSMGYVCHSWGCPMKATGEVK